ILIKRVLYQDSLRFDPFAQEPDFSDATRGAVIQWVPWKEYKRKYPRSTLAAKSTTEIEGVKTDYPTWFNTEDGSEAVLIVDYFWLETAPEIDAVNTKGESVKVPDVKKWRTLYRCIVNAVEELEPQTRKPGR